MDIDNHHSSAWPSGLRRTTQVRMERSAQVRTLPLTLFVFDLRNYVKVGSEMLRVLRAFCDVQ